MAPFILLAGSLAAFLAAAKAHGRQVRLERELAGVFSVVFGGKNPEAVESIWRKDRWVFWSVLAGLFLASAGYGLLSGRVPGRSPAFLVPMALLWSFIGAFFVAGMASALRTLLAIQGGSGQGEEWMSRALWGSLGWWTLALVLTGGLLVSAFRSSTP